MTARSEMLKQVWLFARLIVTLTQKFIGNMRENQLLSAIRLQNISLYNKPGRNGHNEPFFFKLNHSQDKNGFTVQTVDAQGKAVYPEDHFFTGAEAAVLRQLDLIRNSTDSSFSWSGRAREIILAEYPALIFLLMQCENLVGEDGKKLVVCKETFKFGIILKKEKGEYIPLPYLQPQTDDSEFQFEFISDSFVFCSDNKIRPIENVGNNYGLIHLFCKPFKEDFFITYLSLYASFLDIKTIHLSECEIEESSKEVFTQPTMFFEKVDDDGALYMRVGCTLPGEIEDIIEDIHPTFFAEAGMENKIIIHPIRYSSEDEAVKEIKKSLAKSAGNKSAQKEIYQDENFFIIPPETASTFLSTMLPKLISSYRILGTGNLADYKYTTPKPKLNLKLSSGIDFLEGDASVEIGTDIFTIKDFIAMYDKNRYIELSSLDKAIIDEDYIKKLRRLLNRADRKGKLKLSFFDLPEVEALLEKQNTLPAFQHHREVYEGFNKLSSENIPKIKIKGALRPYQAEGLKWIKYLSDNNLGGCLADDMGLGKTIQTIAMLSTIYPKAKKPSLIVMPKSLLFNWRNEFEKFAPQIKIYSYYGTDRDLDKIKECNVCLSSYAVVRNDIETLKEISFNYIILDESQNIKNVGAQTTKGIYLLNGDKKLALSGTPIENNLSELYSLFHFLNPAMFGTIERFNEDYGIPIQKNSDKEATRSLKSKISPFILRRLKQDVLTDLPDRMDQILYVEMEGYHKEYYESRRKYYKAMIDSSISTEGIEKSQFLMFQAFNELRQIASIPEAVTDGKIESGKVPVLMERIEELVMSGHKIAVFFNYLAGIELVEAELESAGIGYVTMTGATGDRERVVRRFQEDSQTKVMLMTLKTGGVGLNLTAADCAFIFEPWWNKAAEEQAIGRLHRIGQTSKVMSFQMITLGTIEEKIMELQQKKKDLVDALISSDKSMSKFLSREDIDFILG